MPIEIHPLAAWQRRRGLTLRQLHILIAEACRARNLAIPSIGTLRNVVGGHSNVGAAWSLAVVDATDGEVDGNALLAFQGPRAGRAA